LLYRGVIRSASRNLIEKLERDRPAAYLQLDEVGLNLNLCLKSWEIKAMIRTYDLQRSEEMANLRLLLQKSEADKFYRSMALPAMSDSADLTLIQASLEGDRTAFAELIGRYRAAIFRTVRRTLGDTLDNEDAVQEVFIRAMIALPKYDQRYPFAPWILKIASNYCIDQLRRRKNRKYKLWSDLSEAEEQIIIGRMSTQPKMDDLAKSEQGKYLEVAQSLLNKLKPRRRMAFVLREIEGRDYEEVAAILGVPETTVRVRVWRARNDLHKKFRKYLESRGQR
jgi:RNA polymerase sigma-70 factor, ECF subfamily